MATIQACQHIYSNVEKERSPQGRGGFQTLFYTHSGLLESEVEEMESRLLYFPSKVEPVKRLFFTTSTGKGVVAQIVFLPNPDEFGRGGRYLAHSLVFASEALLQFETDPFRVFRCFSFLTTVEEALAQGDFKTGDIPAVSLELLAGLAGELNAAGSWPAPELKKLALLPLRAKQHARERETITFTGQPEQIELALEAAFLAVPVSLRPYCTFDTYFYRCNLVATYFWAVGLPEPPVSIKFVQVDSQARQVHGQIVGQPETAYQRWVVQAIDAGQLAELARYRESAFALAEWLDGRTYTLSLLAAAPNELIKAVFKANAQVVQESLRRQVRQDLPPELVNRAAERIWEQATELELYRQLRQGFELAQLLEILYESYAAQEFAEPPRPEIKALAQLLQHTHHGLLNLFLIYWSSPRKQLPKALERADEADYRRFGEIALNLKLLKPLHLLAPGRGNVFLDLYLASGENDWVDLVEALLENGEAACLSRLTNRVGQLPAKDLKKLAGLIDNYPDPPELFRRAVEQTLIALPRQKGIKGMLQTMWGRGEDKR
ncbi:MAG: hypothetical protein JW953_10915 [Anaerolineae bacterium]|nr:hypothetical protein [Anaerolineae bacterium]